MTKWTKGRKRPEGAVAILCGEIDFRFDARMERPSVLVAFVTVLVRHIEHMREMDARIADLTGKAPSAASGEVLRRVLDMLATDDPTVLIEKAAAIHGFIDEIAPEDGPGDHLIDMLSSCVSAIRFGLVTPCQSRHAAEAANHVWRQKYGVSLFDSFTPHWAHDWARAQMQEVLVLLQARARGEK